MDSYNHKLTQLKRELKRIKAVYTGYESIGDVFQEVQDHIKNFAGVSYQLKEMLKKDPSVIKQNPNAKKNVEDFVKSSQWVGLSIDVANTLKHFELYPGSSKSPYPFKTFLSHIDLGQLNCKRKAKISLQMKDGTLIDGLLFAENTLNEWLTFLEQHSLV